MRHSRAGSPGFRLPVAAAFDRGCVKTRFYTDSVETRRNLLTLRFTRTRMQTVGTAQIPASRPFTAMTYRCRRLTCPVALQFTGTRVTPCVMTTQWVSRLRPGAATFMRCLLQRPKPQCPIPRGLDQGSGQFPGQASRTRIRSSSSPSKYRIRPERSCFHGCSF